MKTKIAIALLGMAAASAQADAAFEANCSLQHTFAGQTRVTAKEFQFADGQGESQFLGAVESSALSVGIKDGAAAAPFDMAVLSVQQGFVRRSVFAPIVNGSGLVMYEEKLLGGSSYYVVCEVTKTE